MKYLDQTMHRHSPLLLYLRLLFIPIHIRLRRRSRRPPALNRLWTQKSLGFGFFSISCCAAQCSTINPSLSTSTRQLESLPIQNLPVVFRSP